MYTRSCTIPADSNQKLIGVVEARTGRSHGKLPQIMGCMQQAMTCTTHKIGLTLAVHHLETYMEYLVDVDTPAVFM